MNILCGSQIPSEYIDALKDVFPGSSIILLPASDNVYASISAHPDIFFFEIDKGVLIYSSSVSKDVLNALSESGFALIKAERAPSGAYPDTAGLNAVRVGRYIFHNAEITDDVIKQEACKRTLEFVHVRQGYCRCSIVPVGDNALITSDMGIAETACNIGMDVLAVSSGDVALPGEKYGFLGGACGILRDGTIFFLGDIAKHNDFSLIDTFIRKHGCSYMCLKGLELFDSGSLLIKA